MTRDQEKRRQSPTLKPNAILGNPMTGGQVTSMVVSAGVLIMAPPSGRAAASSTQPPRNSIPSGNSFRRLAEPVLVLACLVLAVVAIATCLILRFRRVAQGAGSRQSPPMPSGRPSPAGAVDRQSRVVPFPPSADEVPEWQPIDGQGSGAAVSAGSPSVPPDPTVSPLHFPSPAPVQAAVADLSPSHHPIRLKPAESGHSPGPATAPMAPARAPSSPSREAVVGTPTLAAAGPAAPTGSVAPSATESLVPSSEGLPPLPKLKLTMSPVPKTVVHVTPAMEFASKRVRQSA